jgi:hypothetical protein
MLNVLPDRPYDIMFDKEVSNLAYEYWEQRGCPTESSQEDWFRAVGHVKREQKRHMRLVENL